MSILKVAASSNISTNNQENSAVNALEKQKMQLSQQIEAVKNSKEDSKTKAAKIKDLTAQMTELDKEIMQAKMQAKEQELQEAQEKNAEKLASSTSNNAQDDEYKEGVIVSASLNKILTANQNFAEYKNLHNLDTKLKGETNVAQMEIKLSAGRAGGSVKYQTDLVAENESKSSGIEMSMGKKLQASQKDIKASARLGIKAAENSRKNDETVKNDEAENTDHSVKYDQTEEVTNAAAATVIEDKDMVKDEKLDKDVQKHKTINIVA